MLSTLFLQDATSVSAAADTSSASPRANSPRTPRPTATLPNDEFVQLTTPLYASFDILFPKQRSVRTDTTPQQDPYDRGSRSLHHRPVSTRPDRRVLHVQADWRHYAQELQEADLAGKPKEGKLAQVSLPTSPTDFAVGEFMYCTLYNLVSPEPVLYRLSQRKCRRTNMLEVSHAPAYRASVLSWLGRICRFMQRDLFAGFTSRKKNRTSVWYGTKSAMITQSCRYSTTELRPQSKPNFELLAEKNFVLLF